MQETSCEGLAPGFLQVGTSHQLLNSTSSSYCRRIGFSMVSSGICLFAYLGPARMKIGAKPLQSWGTSHGGLDRHPISEGEFLFVFPGAWISLRAFCAQKHGVWSISKAAFVSKNGCGFFGGGPAKVAVFSFWFSFWWFSFWFPVSHPTKRASSKKKGDPPGAFLGPGRPSPSPSRPSEPLRAGPSASAARELGSV